MQVEFVSANPTGPLHVGHGRGAAYGAAVADLLEAVGHRVHREYYVNDAGRQMDILAASVWLRYLELCGETSCFPSTVTRAITSATSPPICTAPTPTPSVIRRDRVRWRTAGRTRGRRQGSAYRCADRARQATARRGGYRKVFDLGLNTILDDIREDLAEFGVVYQQWYSERSLAEGGAVDRTIDRLRDAGHLYEQDGALWFRSTDYGDEKDRVVVRDNGQKTYFASDIAYHLDKFERGFDAGHRCLGRGPSRLCAAGQGGAARARRRSAN